MKNTEYTYDEMVKDFPPYYTASWNNGVIEIAESLSINDYNNSFKPPYATSKEAEQGFRNYLKELCDSKLKIYKDYFEEWKEKSVLQKGIGYTKHRKILKKYEDQVASNVKTMKAVAVFKEVDRNKKYLFPFKKIKKGDPIYTYITHEGMVPLGFYEAVIEKVNYTIDKSGDNYILYPRGDYCYKDSNNNKVALNFQSDSNGVLYSGMVYHEIFLDRENALKSYEYFLTEKQSFYENEMKKNKEEITKIKLSKF